MTADPRTAEVQMANPAVLGLANPFRPLLAAQASPEQHCQWLHDLLPLDDYRAAPEGWLAHTVAQQLPDLLICAGIASGFSLRWADQDGVPVLLVYGGTLQVAQAEARWCLGPGEVLVLNGATTEISSAGVSAVLLICSRRRLLAAACELVGRPRPARAWVERLARSQRFSPGGDGSCDRFRDAHCAACQLRCREGLLLQALRLKLAALALLLASDPRLLLLLQPQRQLFQQLALLLFPELTAAPAAIPTAGIPASAAPSGPSLEPLLDYIRRHLDQPLTLEHLVQRCHYSRRSLQYAFRQRFQLSPMAWIRQQRLERAWRRLSQPQPGDAVASIARSCGYRHLSSFSRDFRRAFGCLPSALLRSAHQRDSQATGCRPGAVLRIRAACGERKGGGAQPLTELSESDWLSHKPLPGDQAPNPS